MENRRFSFLNARPDWRYREAISISPSIDLESIKDKYIKRFVKSCREEHINDDKLYEVVTLPYEDRGLIEALTLGGASILEISQVLMTDVEFLEILLALYYDVSKSLKSPVLRVQLAQKEINSKEVKQYKLYCAKYGWEQFIKEFYSKEELLGDAPSLTDTYQSLYIELNRKVTEIGLFPTDSAASQKLLPWITKLLETMRYMKDIESETGPAEETDIGLILKSMRENKKASKPVTDIPFLTNNEILGLDMGESDEQSS